jgi:ABC-type nitrate/sulfonate/bicarbonate transport system substrate-binding protein
VENVRVKYLMDPLPSGINAFSINFLNGNPTAAKKVYNAMAKAVDFIRENETEAKKLLAKYTPIKEEIALQGNLYEWFKFGEEDTQSIQKIADILYENKLLEKRINVRELLVQEKELK